MKKKLLVKSLYLLMNILIITLLICYPVRAEAEITPAQAETILKDFDDYFIYEYLPDGDYVESDSIKEGFYIFRVTDSYDYEADFYFCVDKNTGGMYVYYSSGYLVKLDIKIQD